MTAAGTKSTWLPGPALRRPQAGRGEGWGEEPRPLGHALRLLVSACQQSARPSSFGAHCPPSPPRPAPAAPAALSGSRAGGSLSRISRKLCSGKLGIALKVLGGVALFWAVFILGYITGYYVHKCK